MRHLYRLCRNHHCCTTIAVQVVQEWRNSGNWQVCFFCGKIGR
jgi:hypothetical protein